MSAVWFTTLLQHGIMLGAAALIGWEYGSVPAGLLIGVGILLAWHLYHLFLLERWLRTGRNNPVTLGNGPWSQVLARIDSVDQRARENRRAWVSLVREIRASIKAFPDGGVVLNENLEIVRSNKAAGKLLGLKRKRDRGTRIENLIRHPDFVHYLQHGPGRQSIEIPAPVNGEQWLSCRIIPFGLDQKLLLVRDITQIVNITRTRQDFAANAGHELRSPLTVIAGYLDAMHADETLPQAWRGPLADMQQQSQRMQRLIQDLLELSRLESEPRCPRDNAVDITAVLLNAQRDALELAEHPGHIETAIASDARILGDEAELQSIVSNLVSNAVRYTPADGSVTLGWRTDDQGGHLSVSDTGIGVTAEDIPRLTERFYRTDGGRALQKGGTGLGLAIVKHALIRHDASLEIDSKVGAGSRFICHFPKGRLAQA